MKRARTWLMTDCTVASLMLDSRAVLKLLTLRDGLSHSEA